MHPASRFLVAMLFCAFLAGRAFGADQKTETLDLAAARENAQLRSYFARIHFTPSSDSLAQYRADEPGRTDKETALALWQRQLIDMQIEEFVKDVHRKTRNLEEHWEHLNRMRTGERDPRVWRAELQEIEKQANSLRGNLKAAFPDLPERKSEEKEPDKASLRSDPGPEILLIGRQVRELRKTLSDLLFQPTFVTSVAALRSDSPLDFLKRISTVARAVRESM